jgi:hypothetical protein
MNLFQVFTTRAMIFEHLRSIPQAVLEILHDKKKALEILNCTW